MNKKQKLFEKASLMDPKKKQTKSEKKDSKSKIPLIYLIGGGLFITMLLAGLGLSYVISLESTEASKTPLLKGPDLRDDPSKISTPSRSEQYASDIKNRKRNEKKEAIEKDRMNRIAMRWEEIYKGEDPEEGKKEVAPSAILEDNKEELKNGAN